VEEEEEEEEEEESLRVMAAQWHLLLLCPGY
jgi:hypothetical protein